MLLDLYGSIQLMAKVKKKIKTVLILKLPGLEIEYKLVPLVLSKRFSFIS